MSMTTHDVLTSAGGWTCSCSDSGTGGPDEADDHVVAAWASTVPCADLLDPGEGHGR